MHQGNLVIHRQQHLLLLFQADRGEEFRDRFAQGAEGGLFDMQLHLARLGLGQIEQIVDQVQQGPAAGR